MIDYGFTKELSAPLEDAVEIVTRELKKENIRLMLPCNVIVYEKDGRTIVSIIKPTVAMV